MWEEKAELIEENEKLKNENAKLKNEIENNLKRCLSVYDADGGVGGCTGCLSGGDCGCTGGIDYINNVCKCTDNKLAFCPTPTRAPTQRPTNYPTRFPSAPTSPTTESFVSNAMAAPHREFP